MPIRPFALCLLLCLVWLGLSMWVGWYATPLVHPDGFQSIGASFGGRCGRLSWPFLGNFEGYSESWGYHWFGWPLLRSFLSAVLSFSPSGDAMLLHIVRALTAILVALHVFRQYSSAYASFVACAMILLQKGWFCSMAYLYRPETMAALMLWFSAEPIFCKQSCPMWRRCLSVLCMALSPMMHPLALLAASWVALLGIFQGRVFCRQAWLPLIVRWLLPLIAGCLCFAAYYRLNEHAYKHLMDTIQTMHLIKSDAATVVKNLLVSSNNVFLVWPCVFLSIISCFSCFRKWITGHALFLLFSSGSLALAGFAYLLSAGHPNVGHAAVLAPFLGLWSAQVCLIRFGTMTFRRFVLASTVTMILFCTLPLMLVAFAFTQSGPVSARKQASEILAVALAETSGNVLIPLSLWEAAQTVREEDQARIKFSTFPNYAAVQRREAYENQIVESIGEGDILILASHDVVSGGLNDILPNPRHPMFGSEPFWEKIAVYPPVNNVMIKIGRFQKVDLMLEELTLFRYQYTP